MEPIAPNSVISIALEAQEWNQVLEQLANGPYRIVLPLINKIAEQAQRGAAEIERRVLNGSTALQGSRPSMPAPDGM